MTAGIISLNTAVSPGSAGLVTVTWESPSQLIPFAQADPITAATFCTPVDNRARHRRMRSVLAVRNEHDRACRSTLPHAQRNDKRRCSCAAARLECERATRGQAVTWNSARVSMHEDSALLAGYRLALSASVRGVMATALTGWMFRDSLPEIQNRFDLDAREQDDYDSRSEAAVWRREGARYVYCIGGSHKRERS